jgi:hypothetical protein
MPMTLYDMNRRVGAGANVDPKLKLLRSAVTRATTKFGVGGRPKTVGMPRPITLPRLKLLEDPASAEVDEG